MHCRRTLLASLLAALPALHGGDLVGVVTAKPPAASAGGGGDGKYESRRYKFVERIDYAQLGDFVVYVESPVPESGPAAAPGTVVQRNATFEPHVLPVARGTVVEWPNEDSIAHNVFSFAEIHDGPGEPGFDLGLYTKEKVPRVKFEKVGRVDVFCSIHTNMHCVVLVVPSRHFAAADARGRYAIRGLPAGTYRVKAWHERLPAKSLEVTVPAEGEVTADFTLGLGALPKY